MNMQYFTGLTRLDPIFIQRLTYSRARNFASSTIARASASKQSHYETLGIAKTASRMEIKASYFRLSKKYHPDTSDTKDTESMQKFHRLSEAYRILGNDRERRAYDRTLAGHSAHRGAAPITGTEESSRYSYELHERRKRGATHAWEGSGGHRVHPSSRTHTHTRTRPGSGRHYDPTAPPRPSYTTSSRHGEATRSGAARSADAVRNAETPLRGRVARAEAEARAHDSIMRESGVMRFLSMVGILIVVSMIGGLGKGGG